MTNIKNILKRALRATINEDLDSRADKLIEKIQKTEMDEMYDDPITRYSFLDKSEKNTDKPFDERKLPNLIKHTLKNFGPGKIGKRIEPRGEERGGSEYRPDDNLELMEDEMCECGGMVREGECMECGSMKEGTKFPRNQEFDYISEEDEMDYNPSGTSFKADEQACRQAVKDAKGGDEAALDHAKQVCTEAGMSMDLVTEGKLRGKQFKIDKNKNKRIDAEDFKLLHKDKKSKKHKTNKDKEEVEEGSKFTEMLGKTPKGGKFKMNSKTYTDTSDYDVNESITYHIKDSYGDLIKLNEEQLVDLIENIVYEEKSKNFKPKTTQGLSIFNKVHKESGKENDKYFKSVVKKMKDYLKDGSKGTFEMNPKKFPRGNGQLGDMDKKAFEITKDMEDFNYSLAGQNFPNTDGVQFDEKRMEKYYKGHSTTGNAPGGNALDSESNERFDKLRKKNTLKKLKDQSYKRVSQPVFDEKFDEVGKINLKMESTNNKKEIVLIEEFDRIKDLLNYNRKTQ